NVNRATRVFCGYKYPKSEIMGENENNKSWEYVSVIEMAWDCERSMDNDNHKKQINSSMIPFDEQLLPEKLQMYNIINGKKTTKAIRERKLHNQQSLEELPLGPIPWQRIPSVSSLIVFNTSKNAYTRQVIKEEVITPLKKSESKRTIHASDEFDS